MVMWLAVRQALRSHVEITPANGKPASSDAVVADLYQGLSAGYVRVEGERFKLTSAGVRVLDAGPGRASTAAREALAAAPSHVSEILADVESRLTS